MLNVYKNQQNRQTGSRNLMGPKTLPTIWGTYVKLVTKYQIPAINSCWEKCDEKCAYMFNVYKNQLSRQTGSRNLTGPKMLPTIWHTYMMLVTKYQISAINSYLCNQWILPLKLWVWTPFMSRCTWYNIMWSSLSVTCDRSVVFSGDRHDITEILLKLVLRHHNLV
jgi:hypothetical protein